MDMVRRVGLADQFEIASAATSREEIWHGKGNPVYPPARISPPAAAPCSPPLQLNKKLPRCKVKVILHRGVIIGLFVKRRVGHIVIFAVQLIGGYPQPLTEALVMDNLPLPQELDWLDNIRIVYQAQNVVIGDPRLLLCCNHIRTTID